MASIFIAGSITIKQLDLMVQERLMNIIHMGHEIIIGDADGVDAAVQQFLLSQAYQRVTVFCSGKSARHNIGNWKVQTVSTSHKPGSRAFFTAKDVALAQAADNGLMIWDSKSTGTLSNVVELLSRKKYSWVYIMQDQAFHALKKVDDLETLLTCMSPSARRMADTRIGLTEKLACLHSREMQMTL